MLNINCVLIHSSNYCRIPNFDRWPQTLWYLCQWLCNQPACIGIKITFSKMHWPVA